MTPSTRDHNSLTNLSTHLTKYVLLAKLEQPNILWELQTSLQIKGRGDLRVEEEEEAEWEGN